MRSEAARPCGRQQIESDPTGLVHGRRRIAYARYRWAGGINRKAAEKSSCAGMSTGRCLAWLLAGCVPRELPPCQSVFGRMGRGSKPPPQLGQTLWRAWSAHVSQNMHSNEQMWATSAFVGSSMLQCSHDARSSSIGDPLAFSWHVLGSLCAWVI